MLAAVGPKRPAAAAAAAVLAAAAVPATDHAVILQGSKLQGSCGRRGAARQWRLEVRPHNLALFAHRSCHGILRSCSFVSSRSCGKGAFSYSFIHPDCHPSHSCSACTASIACTDPLTTGCWKVRMGERSMSTGQGHPAARLADRQVLRLHGTALRNMLELRFV